jgi:hypothetical protein
MSFEHKKPTYQEAVTEDTERIYFLEAKGAAKQTEIVIQEKETKAIEDTYKWIQTALEDLIVKAIQKGETKVKATLPTSLKSDVLTTVLRECGYRFSVISNNTYQIGWNLDITIPMYAVIFDQDYKYVTETGNPITNVAVQIGDTLTNELLLEICPPTIEGFGPFDNDLTLFTEDRSLLQGAEATYLTPLDTELREGRSSIRVPYIGID